jgi:hypothetical protein
MPLHLANNSTNQARLPASFQHERYGPYFVYPRFRRALDFGGARSFELLIAAFRDPRVTPERSLGMLNGLVLIWHGAEHEIIVLEGHRCADRIHPEAPTEGQVLEFRRLSQLSWEGLVRFCRSTPATRPRWRQEGTWVELIEPESGIHTDIDSEAEAHVAAI